MGYDVGSSPSVNSKSHGYVAPGGTLGGITSGELLVFRVGIKPASSISQDQEMARVREELGREPGVELLEDLGIFMESIQGGAPQL